MKLAHLILAHSRPSQLERLIKRLIYKDTDIYIHLDKKSNFEDFRHLASLQNVFFIINTISIVWANYSMVAATLNSLEEILESGAEYTHINLLSGMDYPLTNVAHFQAFLFANIDKTFLSYRHISTEWPESESRFKKYSLGDYKLPFKFSLQSVLNTFLPSRIIPNKMEAYGRSQWFTMTPECARYVIDYLKDNPNVKSFFRMTWGVDELVFQTILLNSPLRHNIVNNHLRYIKFRKGGDPSPKTLTIEDKHALEISGKYFARKFDADVDSKILDYLDGTADRQMNTSIII